MNKIKERFMAYLKGRNFPSAVLVAVVLASVVFVNVIIYTLSTVIPLYLHSPETVDRSISSASDILFEDAIARGQKVTITFCSYESDLESHTTGKFVYETAKQFEERYPGFITIRCVNVITKLDEDGNSIHDELSMYESDEDVKINSTSVIFSTETSYRVITDNYSSAGYADFFTLDEEGNASSYNGEEVIASSVMWTLKENHSTAYFTVGHGETATPTLYNILICAGYDIKELNLRKNDVPDDAGLVIISNPTADFERGTENTSIITEYDRLNAYAKRGGNFMVFIDPLMKKLPVLESFVSGFGISFATAESGERAIVQELTNAITLDRYAFVTDYADSDIGSAIQSKLAARTGNPDGRVFVNKAAAINLSGNAMPLLTASSSSVLQAGGDVVDNAGGYTVAAYSALENDFTSPAKLFFMSDAMLTATDAIITESYSNKDFLFSVFDVFFDQGDMPYGCRSIIYEDAILENLTIGNTIAYTAVLMAIPAIVMLVGTVILVRRKNR